MQYKELVAKWREYKDMESLANFARLKIEKEILEIIGKDLSEKGINHMPEDLDITTGIDAKFDQSSLDKLHLNWREGLLPALPFWPFTSEWKPDTKKLNALKETAPNVFKQTFREAL